MYSKSIKWNVLYTYVPTDLGDKEGERYRGKEKGSEGGRVWREKKN